MLGKRSGTEALDQQISDLGNLNPQESDFIQEYMLDPENVQSKEQFMLKYFVDFEYPDSQSYLKTYWKGLILKTFESHLNSVSGKSFLFHSTSI
jgi:hypothetical protein